MCVKDKFTQMSVTSNLAFSNIVDCRYICQFVLYFIVGNNVLNTLSYTHRPSADRQTQS